MKKVTVLGATGSIGVSTLDVIAQHPQQYQVYALTANDNDQALLAQVLMHRPRFAVLRDEAAARRLRASLGSAGVSTRVLSGAAGLDEVAADPDVDVVMAAIVGAAGLAPTLAAVRAGKQVLLANKESLVMAGPLFMSAVAAGGGALLPVDSEHNAIFQCLPGNYRCGNQPVGLRRILLTGSGGPFRTRALSELSSVTPAEACAHPNWSMGPKISVDSATMMNKGLELIEACWLFATDPAHIEIVVHPQSIVHSMVEYVDGSILAQLGQPDMRTPIAHALAWPQRIGSGVAALDLIACGRLDFEAPDDSRFPCLRLARDAIVAGGTLPAALNAANEVAVQAFLQGRIRFTAIPVIIEQVLAATEKLVPGSLEEVEQADRRARAQALSAVASQAA